MPESAGSAFLEQGEKESFLSLRGKFFSRKLENPGLKSAQIFHPGNLPCMPLLP